MPDSALPPHLRGKRHWDFPPGLKWVPRGWTAFKWGAPVLMSGNPKLIEQGNGFFSPTIYKHKNGTYEAAPKPINPPGTWQVSRFPDAPWPLNKIPLYFAFTKKNGRHFRIGARWDDVDDYVQFPTFASRKYKGGDAQDTSTGK
jgi:hypothetical protein